MPISTIPVRIRLDSLTCHQHREGWRGAAPYIWAIFFSIGGDSLWIQDDFRLAGEGKFHFSPGSHGNLGPSRFSSGSTRQIPPEVGLWETDFQPLVLPHFETPITGVCGVLAVLLEANNLSEKGAEAGHGFLNEFVQNAVNRALSEFDPRRVDVNNLEESVKEFFVQKVTAFTDGIEDKLTDVVKRSQNLAENIWTLMDKDRLIGYDLWSFSHEFLLGSPNGREYFSVKWRSEKGDDWELKGFAETRPEIAEEAIKSGLVKPFEPEAS